LVTRLKLTLQPLEKRSPGTQRFLLCGMQTAMFPVLPASPAELEPHQQRENCEPASSPLFPRGSLCLEPAGCTASHIPAWDCTETCQPPGWAQWEFAAAQSLGEGSPGPPQSQCRAHPALPALCAQEYLIAMVMEERQREQRTANSGSDQL